MTTSRSSRRARRGTLVRTAGWISAGAMLATAAFAPASAAAANPSAQDVACNNIVHGARSSEFVWATADAAGLTANWATDAAHFDSADHPTVTIRVCVVDADGADHGAIDQNTENDGVQLFPWSVLGYSANPCPDDTLSFGASADSPAVQTKKSDLIVCPAASDEDAANGDEPTDSADEPTDSVDEPTDSVDDPSDSADEPTDSVDDPSDSADDPSDSADDPSDSADDPSDSADEPTSGIDEPTDAVNEAEGGDQPTDGADQPLDSVDQPANAATDPPAGAVLGAVGTPGITPPPTDTLVVASAPTTGGDGWRLVLVLIAATLVGTLASTQPRRARTRA